jgi:hypothetical protein
VASIRKRIDAHTREEMTQLLFYATKEDLLPIFAAAEASTLLKYTRTGRYARPQPPIFASGANIPDLGTADNDASIACDSYLILDRSTDVQVRHVQPRDGTTSFFVDQLINPDSIVIAAGGIRTPGVLLSGRVGTASDSPRSQALMKLFAAPLRKRFRKVGAFWAGPDALTELERGTRLTMSVGSPAEYDLSF